MQPLVQGDSDIFTFRKLHLSDYNLLFTLCFLCFFFFSCDNPKSVSSNTKHSDSNPLSGEILVYAAASLTDSVREIATSFEKENPGLKVNVSVGSSAQLAKQIAHGAPVDIFLSANIKWMDYLENIGLTTSKTRFEPLGNRLAIISNTNNKDPILTIQDLVTDNVRFFAISDYNSVPSGIYAKHALERLNIWQHILPKLVIGNDTRLTMSYVERNEADYGIVYITDANVSNNVKQIFYLPEKSQPEIRYSFSLIKDSPNKLVANAFADYLKSDSSRYVFEEYGFEWLLP